MGDTGHDLDEERAPSLDELLRLAFEFLKEQIHFSLPATVVDFDPLTRTGTIQLGLCRRVAATQQEITIPPVTNVPFFFQGGVAGFLTVPPTKGDTGTAIFSERAMGNWLELGGVVCPESARKFSYTDAQFWPGIDLIPTARTVDMTATVIEHTSLIKVGAGATDFAALAAKVATELNLLWDAVESHLHATPGAPPTGAGAGFALKGIGTGVSTAGSVAATKAKVE